MSRTINVHKAKAPPSKPFDHAHRGEKLTRAKEGKPDARPMPLGPVPVQRRPGRLSGKIDNGFLDPMTDAELDAWEGR